MPAPARLRAVNVGAVRTVRTPSREITTAIWKSPVEGRIPVRGVNLEGDDQADRRVHGGPDKAVYAYAAEDAAWWASEGVGVPLGPGAFGENLTTEGVDVTGAVVGERWRVGSALLEVAQPRLPCFKLGLRMEDPGFPARFARADRPGAYLRIVEEGDLGAGDVVDVHDRPAHGVTVALVSRAMLRDPFLTGRALEAPELAAGLRAQLAERAPG